MDSGGEQTDKAFFRNGFAEFGVAMQRTGVAVAALHRQEDKLECRDSHKTHRSRNPYFAVPPLTSRTVPILVERKIIHSVCIVNFLSS